jgi:hypothetical protein
MIGAGGVGLNVVAGARIAGAGRIVAIDGSSGLLNGRGRGPPYFFLPLAGIPLEANGLVKPILPKRT